MTVIARLARTVESLAARLFERSDEAARAAGWEVTSSGRWGTSRVYRDPRFDQLRSRSSESERVQA